MGEAEGTLNIAASEAPNPLAAIYENTTIHTAFDIGNG